MQNFNIAPMGKMKWSLTYFDQFIICFAIMISHNNIAIQSTIEIRRITCRKNGVASKYAKYD